MILLHGLARRAACMERMRRALEGEGYKVVNRGYPSRKAETGVLCRQAVGQALADPALEGVSRIHFVTHSLGGILVRQYLKDIRDQRIGRVVMLGPPNQGSEVADRLRGWWLYQWINGPAGQQLATDPDSVPNRLGPVEFELGVIAGRWSINWINSLMIEGPDDGKVSVARTRVDGMREQVVVPVAHPFLMKNRRVIRLTRRFLRHGTFSAGDRADP